MLRQLFRKRQGQELDLQRLPRHIGIIMDGNGRWARRRGLPRNMGHRAGAETLRRITEYCDSIGIQAITAYAFSTENWRRPKEEVDGIMRLLNEYLANMEKNLGGKNTRIIITGALAPLSGEIRARIAETEAFTRNNTGIVLNIALNYGGRSEIVHAVREALAAGEEVSEESIERHLYTKNLPPVDLIIRPSGEQRLSNFLLWQAAYAELWYDRVLWPDFSEKHMNRAILDYQQRDRRYGGV